MRCHRSLSIIVAWSALVCTFSGTCGCRWSSCQSHQCVHCRGELRIAIGCVSILKDGTLLKVSVKAAIWGSVVSNDLFDCLYTNLRSLIGVWKCH